MRILLVEDDDGTARAVEKGLADAGHAVRRVADGKAGLRAVLDGTFDVLVLDRMLPSLAGLDLLRSLRSAGVEAPVLMLTALGDVEQRVEGLKAGADDYLVKPFAFPELLARVESLARRAERAQAGEGPPTRLVEGDLEMDLLARTVQRGGEPIELKPREFRLLECLMRHAGQVLTRTMLLEKVWDYHFDPQTNVIDVHISRLRRKVDDGHEPALIRTVRGAGYMLSAR